MIFLKIASICIEYVGLYVMRGILCNMTDKIVFQSFWNLTGTLLRTRTSSIMSDASK